MRAQGAVEYLIFIGIVVLLTVVAARAALDIVARANDAAEVISRFSGNTGVSLNGL